MAAIYSGCEGGGGGAVRGYELDPWSHMESLSYINIDALWSAFMSGRSIIVDPGNSLANSTINDKVQLNSKQKHIFAFRHNLKTSSAVLTPHKSLYLNLKA